MANGIAFELADEKHVFYLDVNHPVPRPDEPLGVPYAGLQTSERGRTSRLDAAATERQRSRSLWRYADAGDAGA